MATEALRVDNTTESIDSLSREAESLKVKLEEEKAKLNDVDSESSYWVDNAHFLVFHRLGLGCSYQSGC